ncbi:MAG TPA: TraY domain-containing protein [Novosphingobium sp.]
MATLTVRRLDDNLYNRLGERARRNNRSLEAEVRDILEKEAGKSAFDMEAWLAEARRLRQQTPARGDGKTSLDVLREERDSW